METKNEEEVTRFFYSKYFMLLVGAVMLLMQLDALYPTIMEARNFVSAREILASHDWIYTTLNGAPRYEKPPLPTWITAIFGYLFGTGNLSTLRIPDALLTLVTGYYIYKIALLFFKDQKIALYSGYIFFTAYLVLYVGRSNVWDVYCYAFMLIAVYYFIRANQNQSWKAWITFGILVGCSLLSKGPMGVLIVFIPFFAGYLWLYNPQFFKRLDYFKALISLFIMVLIGFSWYYYIYSTDYETFMGIFEKEVDARVSRNVKPWYRYISFPVQMAIWVLASTFGLLLWTQRKVIQLSKEYYILLIWTLGGVLILSLFPEKKERYLFPVMFPLSIIAGLCIHYWNHWHIRNKFLIYSRNTFYFLAGILSLALAIGVPFFLKDFNILIIIFSLGMFLLSLSMAGAFMRKKFDHNFKYCVYMAIFIMVFLVPIMLPKFFDNPAYKTVRDVKNQYPNLTVYSLETYSPEIWFTYQEIIPDFDTEQIENGAIRDSTFLLLKGGESKGELDKLQKYKVEATNNFDENLEPEGAPNYSKRKFGKIYLMKRN